jgi:peptidoglycan hydrolase-like protein with peptidoglycan-binding domain
VPGAARAAAHPPDTMLEVDGIFGLLTEATPKEFQQAEGLPVTGVVDEAT